MTTTDICVECKTKHDDNTLKSVSECPLCHRLMCERHLQPKLAYIPNFRDTSKSMKEVQEMIEKNYVNETGHHCLPYTLNFWKNYDLEREQKLHRIKNSMDGFGYYTNEEEGYISTLHQKEMQKEISKPKESEDEKFKPCQDCNMEYCTGCEVLGGPIRRKKSFWKRLFE